VTISAALPLEDALLGDSCASATYRDLDPEFFEGFFNIVVSLLDPYSGSRPDSPWRTSIRSPSALVLDIYFIFKF